MSTYVPSQFGLLIVPLVKYKNEDVCSSGKCRGNTINSLMFKVFLAVSYDDRARCTGYFIAITILIAIAVILHAVAAAAAVYAALFRCFLLAHIAICCYY